MPAKPRGLTLRTVIRSNRIPQVTAELRERFRGAILTAAQNLENTASLNAPRDTGSLSASVYASDGTNNSDYTTRVGNASRLNRDLVVLPEIDPEFAISLSGTSSTNSQDVYVVVVGVAAGHGVYVEYGTRNMHAQPFMTPAVEGARGTFQDDLTTAIGDL